MNWYWYVIIGFISFGLIGFIIMKFFSKNFADDDIATMSDEEISVRNDIYNKQNITKTD